MYDVDTQFHNVDVKVYRICLLKIFTMETGTFSFISMLNIDFCGLHLEVNIIASLHPYLGKLLSIAIVDCQKSRLWSGRKHS